MTKDTRTEAGTQARNEYKEYLDLAQAKLREWRARIDQLKVRSNIASMKAEDRVRKNVEKLDERYDSIRDNLSKLASAGEQGWKDVRNSLEEAWGKLAKEFERAGGPTG